MNQSYWERTSFFKDVDYAIIGAGIVGLFAALQIKNKQPNANVLVLERSLIPDGASTKNAGFACFGSLSELIVQLENSSENELVELVKKRWEGLKKLRKDLGDENIEYKNFGGYEIFTKEDDARWKQCVERLTYFNELLKPIIGGNENVYSIVDEKINDFGFSNVEHLIFNPYEAQIHSGKMMQTLINKCYAAGVNILFGYEVNGYRQEKELLIEVTNFNQQQGATNQQQGSINQQQGAINQQRGAINHQQANHQLSSTKSFNINAKKLLICNNGFVKKLLPTLDVTPGRGQVFITKPIIDLKIEGTFHYEAGYYYFRNIDDRVLIGGGRNLNFENETTTEFGITTTVKNKITTLLNETILPNTSWEFDMEWSGIMAFGKELKPIVAQIEPNVYCAVRCNGMGVAVGSKVGEEAAVLVTRNS